jgi:hypothetical protein
MIKNIGLLFDYFASPGETANELKTSKIGLFSFAVFVMAIFTQSLANQILIVMSDKSSTGLFSLDILLGFIISGLSLFVFTAWTHFMSDVFNKISSVKTIMKIFCLSIAPLLLCLPLSVFFVTWTNNPWIFYSISAVLIYIKVVHLMFVGIKQSCYLSFGQTLTIFLGPFIIIPLFFMVLLAISLFFVYSIIF